MGFDQGRKVVKMSRESPYKEIYVTFRLSGRFQTSTTALNAQLIADHVHTDIGLFWYVETPPFNSSEHLHLPLYSLLNGPHFSLSLLIRTLFNYHPLPRHAG